MHHSSRQSASPPEKGPQAAAQFMARIAQNQDRTAFSQLFSLYAPRLKGWLMAQGDTDSAAEDILQETFTVLWHKAAQYDAARASVATWLYTIARNVRLARLHHEQRLLPAASFAAEGMLPSAEEAVAVRSMLERLPQEQAHILRDHFFLGLTQEEIAESRAIPLGTVKSRMRLALKKLRSLISVVVWVCILQQTSC